MAENKRKLADSRIVWDEPAALLAHEVAKRGLRVSSHAVREKLALDSDSGNPAAKSFGGGGGTKILRRPHLRLGLSDGD